MSLPLYLRKSPVTHQNPLQLPRTHAGSSHQAVRPEALRSSYQSAPIPPQPSMHVADGAGSAPLGIAIGSAALLAALNRLWPRHKISVSEQFAKLPSAEQTPDKLITLLTPHLKGNGQEQLRQALIDFAMRYGCSKCGDPHKYGNSLAHKLILQTLNTLHTPSLGDPSSLEYTAVLWEHKGNLHHRIILGREMQLRVAIRDWLSAHGYTTQQFTVHGYSPNYRVSQADIFRSVNRRWGLPNQLHLAMDLLLDAHTYPLSEIPRWRVPKIIRNGLRNWLHAIARGAGMLIDDPLLNNQAVALTPVGIPPPTTKNVRHLCQIISNYEILRSSQTKMSPSFVVFDEADMALLRALRKTTG